MNKTLKFILGDLKKNVLTIIVYNKKATTLILSYCYLKSKRKWKIIFCFSRDILHHWAYPLSIESGSLNRNNFTFVGNHNYIHKRARLSK